MKQSFYILLLILLACCLFPACRHKNYLTVIENDWKKNNLKGRVKKIINVRYFESGPEQEIEEFNEQGFLVRSIYSVASKNKVDPTFYEYDTTGNTKIVTWTKVDGVRTKSYYDYDENGNLVTEECDAVRKTYSFDDSNRLVEDKVYINGSLYDKTISKYKQDGSMVSVTTDGRTGRKTVETSKNDSVEFRTHFDDKGGVEYTDLFKYDKAGNLLYGKSEGKDRMFYTSYYYNDHNDVIMEVKFDSKKNSSDTTVYTYTYDKTGNWIEKKGKCDRQITYW
jgi:hypothetical protein